ncbi:MAG: hypothetical protein ACPL3A_01450 [Thermoanaerobacteraceae bacterium]
MNMTIVSVKSKSDMNKFIKLPWEIYRNDKNWVPPLIKNLKKILNKSTNSSLEDIDFILYLVLSDRKPVGRILTGIDNNLNKKKTSKIGYFSLLETINDYEVFKLLMDTSIKWLKDKNITLIKGPVSPNGIWGDEYKGLLIDDFQSPPVLMNSYNPSYYKDFIEKYGFYKDYDLYAYYMDASLVFKKNPAKVIDYAKKKYNFYVESLNTKNIEKEIRDLKYIADKAIPEDWTDLVPPSLDDIKNLAKDLLPIADPDLIIIARSENEPIGFGLALPDYNQVLKHLNGKLTPISIIKYFWYKTKIKNIRFFIMLVVPEFRKKGVSYAIYYQTFLNAIKKGYISGEGSTIGETNISMRNDIESFGGKHYKTYRIYKKEIT